MSFTVLPVEVVVAPAYTDFLYCLQHVPAFRVFSLGLDFQFLSFAAQLQEDSLCTVFAYNRQ